VALTECQAFLEKQTAKVTSRRCSEQPLVKANPIPAADALALSKLSYPSSMLLRSDQASHLATSPSPSKPRPVGSGLCRLPNPAGLCALQAAPPPPARPIAKPEPPVIGPFQARAPWVGQRVKVVPLQSPAMAEGCSQTFVSVSTAPPLVPRPAGR
jgi:hypothetical protein